MKFGKEEEVEPNHAFNLIKCKDTTVIIEGKIKSVMLENCQNIKLSVDNVMASVEVINCKKVTVHIKEL